MAKIKKTSRVYLTKAKRFLIFGLSTLYIAMPTQAKDENDFKLVTFNGTKHDDSKCLPHRHTFSGAIQESECLNINSSFNAVFVDTAYDNKDWTDLECKLRLFDGLDCVGDGHVLREPGCFSTNEFSPFSAFSERTSAYLSCEGRTDDSSYWHKNEAIVAISIATMFIFTVVLGVWVSRHHPWQCKFPTYNWRRGTRERRANIMLLEPTDLPRRPERSHQPYEDIELVSLSTNDSNRTLVPGSDRPSQPRHYSIL